MSEIKDFLSRARGLKKEIEAAQDQILILRGMAERTTGTYQALRVSGTSEKSKLENAVLDIADLETEVAEKMARFRDAYKEIAAVIDALEDAKVRQLLTLRYLCFMTWEAVAEKMGYSYVHVVHRLHPKALRKIQDVIECNTSSVL